MKSDKNNLCCVFSSMGTAFNHYVMLSLLKQLTCNSMQSPATAPLLDTAKFLCLKFRKSRLWLLLNCDNVIESTPPPPSVNFSFVISDDLQKELQTSLKLFWRSWCVLTLSRFHMSVNRQDTNFVTILCVFRSRVKVTVTSYYPLSQGQLHVCYHGHVS
jgi:hypothetical protein